MDTSSRGSRMPLPALRQGKTVDGFLTLRSS